MEWGNKWWHLSNSAPLNHSKYRPSVFCLKFVVNIGKSCQTDWTFEANLLMQIYFLELCMSTLDHTSEAHTTGRVVWEGVDELSFSATVPSPTKTMIARGHTKGLASKPLLIPSLQLTGRKASQWTSTRQRSFTNLLLPHSVPRQDPPLVSGTLPLSH